MNKIILTLSVAAAMFVVMGVTESKSDAGNMPTAGGKKILVAYFSLTGNTRQIANQIHELAGGDIFEIQPVNPYPTDYNTVVEQARKELQADYKPALKTKIENIKAYDLIFIGYPIWFGTYPPPVKTFLSENDFSGKTVVPFCTHGGGGAGSSSSDVSKLCPKSTLLEGFVINGADVKTAKDKVSDWLRRINVIK